MLCFLAGAPEIRRAADALSSAAARAGVAVLPLHGGLDAEAQDAAVRPASGRRVVLATNIAETTLTVPDVTCVIDTGLHKVARYDAERAIDSLDLERISQDSADQRAGRAGRTQPGVAIRLSDSRDRLRVHREPEIARIDLAGPALDVLAWGGDPRAFGWFESPPADALEAALDLLHQLGAVDAAGRLTSIGRDVHRLPLHPRLGGILLAAPGALQAARACALLSERHHVPGRGATGSTTSTTSCDLLAATDRDEGLPSHVERVTRQIRDAARSVVAAPLADREALADDTQERQAKRVLEASGGASTLIAVPVGYNLPYEVH